MGRGKWLGKGREGKGSSYAYTRACMCVYTESNKAFGRDENEGVRKSTTGMRKKRNT